MPAKAISTVVFFVTLVAGRPAPALGQAIPSMAELRARASQRYIPAGLRVAYDVYQEPADGIPETHIPHLFQDVLVDAATGRYSIDRLVETRTPQGNTTPGYVTLSFDGNVQAAFLPEEMIGVVQEGSDVDGLLETGLLGVMLLNEPQPDGLGIDDGSLVSYLDHGTVRKRRELVGDVPCLVVDAFHEGVRYATLWLDDSRDLLPMKRITYDRNGDAATTVTVDSVVYLEQDDRYIPDRWRTEMRLAGRIVRSRVEVIPDDVALDPPISDEEFQAQFLPDTVVADQIQGLVYRIDESGEPGEVLYENVDGEWLPVSSAEADTPAPADITAEPHAAPDQPVPEGQRPARSILDELMRVKRLLPASREPVDDKPSEPSPAERLAVPERDAGTGPSRPAASAEQPAQARTDGFPDSQPVQAAGRSAGVESPTTATHTGKPRESAARALPLLCGALLVALVVGIGYARRRRKTVGNDRATPRLHRLAGRRLLLSAALLALLGLVVWKVCFFAPSPRIQRAVGARGQPHQASATSSQDDASSPFASIYNLRSDEAIRYIPNPDPHVRRAALKALGIVSRSDCPVESLTVEWAGGAPHFGSLCVGYGSLYQSRRLLYVLRDSLKIPLYRMGGLEVARRIGLSGDWVVRSDATLDERLSSLEKIVREAGYPGFHVERRHRKQTRYVMRGVAHAPRTALVLLPAPPGVPESTKQTGSLKQFAEALAAAIRHPVAMKARPAGLTITWRDNSAAYAALGSNVSAKTVRELLDEISADLGVTFESTDEETACWELRLRPQQ